MPDHSRRAAAGRAPQALNDAANEHILLEGDEAPQFEGADSHKLRGRLALSNRLRGIKIIFRLFEGGYLGVERQTRGRSEPERVLYLRYLDSRPISERYVPRKALRIAVGLIALEFVLGVVAYSTARPGLIALLALGTGIVMGAALLVLLRGTEERTEFRTHYGRVSALTVVANFGCFRASRRTVRLLANAIAEARRADDHDKRRALRDEMREHYRLCEVGLLTKEACAAGTQRILAQFD